MTNKQRLDRHEGRLNSHYSRLNDLDSDNPQKEFKALLFQTGTAIPTLTILKNTLGVVPTMARTSAGLYTLTVTNDVFQEGKTLIYGLIVDDATDDKVIGAVRTSDNVITISQAIATVATDAIVESTLFIEVYP